MKLKSSRLLIFIALACLIGTITTTASYVFMGSSTSPSTSSSSNHCAFCDPQILERQTFYEDELVVALYTHRPIFPGHSLVIPKRHVERFEGLTEAEMTQISRVLKKVDLAAKKIFGTSSYLLLQKNGREAGQSVPHVHFHYIPRTSGDTSVFKFFAHMVFAELGQPISHAEMKIVVDQMRAAMEEVDTPTSL